MLAAVLTPALAAALTLAALLASGPCLAYNDHRGHNLDSLERVVARWTPDAIDKASEHELVKLNLAYRNLMLGWNVLNGEKAAFYARKALQISEKHQWMEASYDAYRYLGQILYGNEQYDSAKAYYLKSLACVDAMAAGATSPTNPDGYSQHSIDDAYSSLYGSIGNLYNMMDSIPQAMEWYEKAGALFEKNGWNESNSVLWYNIGETWVDEGDMKKAAEAYEKSLAYADASGDSLMIVDAWKGLGRFYAESGKAGKALSYLRKAEAYYAAHPKEAPHFRTENLEYMSSVLHQQKKHLAWVSFGTILLALLVISAMVAFRRRRAADGVAIGEADGGGDAGSVQPGPSGSAPLQDSGYNTGSNLQAPKLSAKEREILDLIARGYTSSQIADTLCLSNETIRWYRKKLLVKFDASNTAELLSISKDAGII